MRIGTRGVLVVFLAVLSGCETRETEPPPRSPPQLVLREPLTAQAPLREVGEDCRLNGKSICRGPGGVRGECIHTGMPPDDVFTCTRRCLTDSDCPEAWPCVDFLSDGRSLLCQPPPNLRPGRAAERQPGNPDAGRRPSALDAGRAP